MKFNSKKFRELVLRKGLSIKELSDMTGCSQNAIGRYLRDGQQPQIKYWNRLAEALGIDVTELLEE